jgi:hypothetical protein
MESSQPAQPLLVPPYWMDSFERLLSVVDERLLIVSPFIRFRPGLKRLIEVMPEREKASSVCIHVVTDFSTRSLATGATDPRALLRLFDAVPGTQVSYLRRVHAKVYIADERIAIVTSGNLTAGGLLSNYEYGVQLEDKETVRKLVSDLMAFARRGSSLCRNDLVDLAKKARRLRAKFKAIERAVETPDQKDLQSAEDEAEVHLQHICGRERTLTQQFVEVIVPLLGRHGPLDTQALYEHLKRSAPELCTDRGQERSYSVWQRDTRNALTKLQEQKAIELLPTRGYERKGVYRLVSRSTSA